MPMAIGRPRTCGKPNAERAPLKASILVWKADECMAYTALSSLNETVSGTMEDMAWIFYLFFAI